MQTEKYKALATDIMDLLAEGYVHSNGRLEPYEPAEYQAGLTFALAIYLKTQFPGELMEVYRLHCQSMLLFLEELDAKSHPDDVLEISSVRL